MLDFMGLTNKIEQSAINNFKGDSMVAKWVK